jgi:hypothetical protein
MRRQSVLTVVSIVASGLALVAVRAANQPAEPQAPAAPPARDIQRPEAGADVDRKLMQALVAILNPAFPQIPQPSEKMIAGLEEQAPAEWLTWRRVYELALIRSRSGAMTIAETLDPQALSEQAPRHGVADFARFRKEFLTGRTASGDAFHDPGEAYFRVLRRLQAIDDTHRYVWRLEIVQKLLRELAQGETSAVTQLQLDLLADTIATARRQLSMEVAGFREDLDDLKVALGLSPHAPVLPDRRELAGFREVWGAVQSWSSRPDRDLAELPRIVERLPASSDVVVNGRPILQAIEQAPDRLDNILREATLLAIKNRVSADGPKGPSESNVATELKVRRRIRHLLDLRRDGESHKRSYELAIRIQDELFDRLPNSAASGSALVRGARATTAIIEAINHMRRVWVAEDQLVANWASFRLERLALYRDLGVLPYDNWDAFFADLSARPSATEPTPTAPAGPQPTPPAPPPARPAGP